jgi:hypothetical protein
MPYDSSLPADGSEIRSDELRSQFAGLKALIDAIGAIVAAQVDGVMTLNPGDPAAASVTVTGDTLHFTFAIPRGNDGAQGAQGDPGGRGRPARKARPLRRRSWTR